MFQILQICYLVAQQLFRPVCMFFPHKSMLVLRNSCTDLYLFIDHAGAKRGSLLAITQNSKVNFTPRGHSLRFFVLLRTYFLDILLNFRTTFVNGKGEVVSGSREIALNYLRTWFFLDLVAALPFELFDSLSDSMMVRIRMHSDLQKRANNSSIHLQFFL